MTRPQPKTELQRWAWTWFHIALAFLVTSLLTSALCVLVIFWGLGLSYRVTYWVNTGIQFIEAIAIYRWTKRRPPTLEDL